MYRIFDPQLIIICLFSQLYTTLQFDGTLLGYHLGALDPTVSPPYMLSKNFLLLPRLHISYTQTLHSQMKYNSSAESSADSSANFSASESQSQSESEREPGSHGTPPGSPPKRRRNLSWGDFQDDDPIEELASTSEDTLVTPLTVTKNLLREELIRFQREIPLDIKSNICCPPDRSAVIIIYNKALSRIAPDNHSDIYAEAKSKINIILGLSKAKYTDPAFTERLLPPLEPMYADPRIEYSSDPYGRHAHWRLNAWRKERWPLFLPVRAIKDEKARKNRRLEVGERRWKVDDDDWDDPGSVRMRGGR